MAYQLGSEGREMGEEDYKMGSRILTNKVKVQVASQPAELL